MQQSRHTRPPPQAAAAERDQDAATPALLRPPPPPLAAATGLVAEGHGWHGGGEGEGEEEEELRGCKLCRGPTAVFCLWAQLSGPERLRARKLGWTQGTWVRDQLQRATFVTPQSVNVMTGST